MIVIAIPRFIALKGLESLISELCLQKTIHTAKDEDELKKLLDQTDLQLLYIHSSFVHILNSVSPENPMLSIVRVIDNRPKEIDLDGFQSDILYLDDSENKVVKNLKRNLALIEKSHIADFDGSDLSERERDVLKEIALGKTNKEIADNLFISAHTVITHRKNITKKLGIKTVSGLTVYAILNKIIQIEEF